MAQIINGPGVGLPAPQVLYPAQLYNAPYTGGTNKVILPPGATLTIPAGQWFVSMLSSSTACCVIQWFDPVRQEWWNTMAPATAHGTTLKSDGFNVRVANIALSAYGGIVTTPGTGYVQATTTVTPGTGNSTWQPIVGGALGTFTVVNGGSGYTMTPTVFIPSPAAPGIAATALATLSAGAVASITVSGAIAGAGYLVAPPVIIVPDPTDPSTNIVNATATVVLTGAGTITGLLLKNFGTALTTAPTLTVGGSGSSAVVTTNPAAVVATSTVAVTLQPAVGP